MAVVAAELGGVEQHVWTRESSRQLQPLGGEECVVMLEGLWQRWRDRGREELSATTADAKRQRPSVRWRAHEPWSALGAAGSPGGKSKEDGRSAVRLGGWRNLKQVITDPRGEPACGA